MDEQGILDLLLSSQPENIALAEQLLVGAGIPLIQLLDKFGYSQIGITGFEFFERQILTIFHLSSEKIPKLPASLKVLTLKSAKVQQIDLSQPYLQKLYVVSCLKLNQLNLSNCIDLSYLYCFNGKLNQLNLKGCVNLERLHCDNNNLTELNVQDCIRLEVLYCHHNQITELNVENCVNLDSLGVDEGVTVLNLPKDCILAEYSINQIV